MTGGWQWKESDYFALEIDAFDVGHAEVALTYTIAQGFNATCMVSAYSPGISFSVFGTTISINLELGSIGGSIKASPNDYSFGLADGIGLTVGISW